MPIYEYQCRDCKYHFEYLATSASDTAAQCPACSSKDVSKAISATHIRMGSIKRPNRFGTGGQGGGSNNGLT